MPSRITDNKRSRQVHLLMLAGRILIPVVILALLLQSQSFVSMSSVFEAEFTLTFRIVLPIIALPIVGLLANALKWNIILSDSKFLQTLFLHWAGEFVSLAGLGSLGNDAYKFTKLRAERNVVRDIVTIRFVGAIAGTTAATVIFFTNRFSGFLLVLVVVLFAKFFYRSPKSLFRDRRVLDLAVVASVQMTVTIFIFLQLFFVFGDARVSHAAALAVIDLWSLILPLTYQGIGVREATFSLVGESMLQSGATYFQVGALVSLSTIAVRLTGIVPYILLMRPSQRNTVGIHAPSTKSMQSVRQHAIGKESDDTP